MSTGRRRACEIGTTISLVFIGLGSAQAQAPRPDWTYVDVGLCKDNGRTVAVAAAGGPSDKHRSSQHRIVAEVGTKLNKLLDRGVDVTLEDGRKVRHYGTSQFNGDQLDYWRDPDTCDLVVLAKIDVPNPPSEPKETCEELFRASRSAQPQAPPQPPQQLGVTFGFGRMGPNAKDGWMIDAGETAKLRVSVLANEAGFETCEIRAKLIGAPDSVRLVEPMVKLPASSGCKWIDGALSLQVPKAAPVPIDLSIEVEVIDPRRPKTAVRQAYKLKIADPVKVPEPAPPPPLPKDLRIEGLTIREVEGDGRLQPGDTLRVDATLSDQAEDATLGVGRRSQRWAKAHPSYQQPGRSADPKKRALSFAFEEGFDLPIEPELGVTLLDREGNLIGTATVTMAMGLPLEPTPIAGDGIKGLAFAISPAKGVRPPAAEAEALGRWLQVALRRKGLSVAAATKPKIRGDSACYTAPCQRAAIKANKGRFVAAVRIVQKMKWKNNDRRNSPDVHCEYEAAWTDASGRREERMIKEECYSAYPFVAIGALAEEISRSLGR